MIVLLLVDMGWLSETDENKFVFCKYYKYQVAMFEISYRFNLSNCNIQKIYSWSMEHICTAWMTFSTKKIK